MLNIQKELLHKMFEVSCTGCYLWFAVEQQFVKEAKICPSCMRPLAVNGEFYFKEIQTD